MFILSYVSLLSIFIAAGLLYKHALEICSLEFCKLYTCFITRRVKMSPKKNTGLNQKIVNTFQWDTLSSHLTENFWWTEFVVWFLKLSAWNCSSFWSTSSVMWSVNKYCLPVSVYSINKGFSIWLPKCIYSADYFKLFNSWIMYLYASVSKLLPMSNTHKKCYILLPF